MKLRHEIITVCAVALLAPAVVLAADNAATDVPRAAKQPEADKAPACTPVTGTRIRPAKGGKCGLSNRPSQTFTADQLRQTGYIDLVEALRSLTPIVR